MTRHQYIEQIQYILTKPNFWRLFVDGRNQREDFIGSATEVKYGYLAWALREPHGLDMIRTTAKYLFSTNSIDTPLSYELIKGIHKLCFPLQDNLILSDAISDKEPRIFGEKTYQKAAYQHLSTKCKKLVEELGLLPSSGSPWKIVCDDAGIIGIAAELDKDTIRSKFPTIATIYEERLARCDDDISKIKLIADTAQTLELLHMFTDGNCRVLITIWLNKELIRAGLSPAIFENPNDFDWKSTEQLVKDVITGQKAFQDLCSKGYPYKQCITDSEIDNNFMTLYETHCSQLDTKQKTKPYIDLLRHNLFLSDEQIATGRYISTTELGMNAIVSKMIMDMPTPTQGSFNDTAQNMLNTVKTLYGFAACSLACEIAPFRDWCNSQDINLQSLSLQNAFSYYKNFLSKIHELAITYKSEKYLLDGKFPMMFLSATICHLNGEEYETSLSKAVSSPIFRKLFDSYAPADVAPAETSNELPDTDLAGITDGTKDPTSLIPE